VPTSESALVVAVDGPSGSGKSSVSRAVARRFGLRYLDTGAMYRALTWWCLDQDVDLADRDAVVRAMDELPLAMGTDPAAPSVFVGAVDVGEAIRQTRVSEQVSAVATNLDVRARMRDLQRRLIGEAGGGVVAEGRDITTVVAPDAPVRILLTAAPSVRAARRSAELTGHDADTVADALHRRDAQDSTVVDFLTAAPGVQVVDSSDLDFEQTVDAVLDVVRAVVPTQTGARDER